MFGLTKKSLAGGFIILGTWLALIHFNLSHFSDALYPLTLFFIALYFFEKNEDKKPAGLVLFFAILISAIKLFAFDVYKTPTPSMTPTIPINKTFLVNKLAYGINIPFLEKTGYQWKEPQKGEIILFHHSFTNKDGEIEKVPYLKRVIGVEGDVIFYDFVNKELYIAKSKDERVKEKVNKIHTINNKYIVENTPPSKNVFIEESSELAKHFIYQEKGKSFSRMDDDHVIVGGVKMNNISKYVVGKNEVFVMGDNRDESADSRFFGPIKTEKVIGNIVSFIIPTEDLKVD